MPLTPVRTLLHPPKRYIIGVSETAGQIVIPHNDVFNVYSVTCEVMIRVFTLRDVNANTHVLFKYEAVDKPFFGLRMGWGPAHMRMQIHYDTEDYLTEAYFFTDTYWHHIVGVYDAEIGELRLYVDGSLFDVKSVPTGLHLVNNGPIRTPWENGRAMDIAYQRMYNKPLTVQEVRYNKQNPMSPVMDELVLWLKMEEGSGTTVHDYSGYGNDGTIYGATWTEITHDPVRFLSPVRVLPTVR